MYKATAFVLSLCVLLVLPVRVFAVAEIAVLSPMGDGVFVVQGNDLDGVYGLYLSISFDGSALANPRVELGTMSEGMTNAVNPGNPIRIAIVGTTSLKGSGTLATIAFDRSGSSSGGITAVGATAFDAREQAVAMAQPVVVNPSQPPVPTAQTNSGSSGSENEEVTQAPPAATQRGYVAGGTLTVPGGEPSAPAEKREGDVATVQQERPETGQTAQQETVDRPRKPEDPDAATGAKAEETVKDAETEAGAPVRIESVLERFKLFQGEKTPLALTGLFKVGNSPLFIQSPPIALADGKSHVALAIAKIAGDKVPRFTFQNAKFLSLSQAEGGEWTIEVVPDKGAVQASVTMLLNGMRQEFPLTVTPKADTGVASPAATEAEFLLFLKERGTATAPKFDLNGDGKRDYLDDYIYTANYLLRGAEKK